MDFIIKFSCSVLASLIACFIWANRANVYSYIMRWLLKLWTPLDKELKSKDFSPRTLMLIKSNRRDIIKIGLLGGLLVMAGLNILISQVVGVPLTISETIQGIIGWLFVLTMFAIFLGWSASYVRWVRSLIRQ